MQEYPHDSSMVLPYFFINPDYHKQPFVFDEFNYSTFSRMPTNNGTAIGTTFEEAMIHAINELVERDSISCFLLSTFGKEKPQNLKLIETSSLPSSIAEIVTKIESDYDEKILLIDISSDLEFPVFLAAFTKQKQHIQPMGFGASLYKSYALERAILEALQSLHLYDENLEAEDELILNKFNEWPKLRKCAQCNLMSILEAGYFEYFEFKKSPKTFLSLKEILDYMIQLLTAKNLHVFYAEHYHSENGVSCVKVMIPGLEEFHRVRYGHFVIPEERGKTILLGTTSHGLKKVYG